MSQVPNYLKDYEAIWKQDPHQANLEWFANAKWGLFMHYGLYSQLKRGEWVMFRENIPIAEYEKLFASFDPRNFNADEITDLALEAGMSYVNITTCHHEGFCLWNSSVESYNSYAACRRDLVAELAEQCDKKGLGFFAYYTHVLNWRHPYAIPRRIIAAGQPAYDFDEPRYQIKEDADIAKYWEYAHSCMKELLALDYPLAGLWLDIIMAYYQNPSFIPIEKTYELIKKERPECLISFKQGATGTEDFASPEYSFNSLGDNLRRQGLEENAKMADASWAKNKVKHNEICMTLQRQNWGYNENSEHYSADEVWQRLAYALNNNCNMLANTGPLPDGTLHAGDVATLRTIGKRIREQGWPKAEDAITPESWTAKKTGAATG